MSGTVHLTMPLPARPGGAQPGEVAGHGPVDAPASRELAALLAARAGTRWCLTVTGPDGRAAGHACARRGPAAGEPVLRWAAGLRARLGLLDTGQCSHAGESPAYRPPARLQHLVRARQRTCCYPGCRRPAVRCDLDQCRALRQGRADLHLQSGTVLPAAPPRQASTRLAAAATTARANDLAHAQRPHLPDSR